MDEVAARSVGAVAVDPILLAVLGLVFVVSHNILLKLKGRFKHMVENGMEKLSITRKVYNNNTYSQLVLAMGKLAEIAVETRSLFLEVAADLGLEPGVGGARSLACDGRVQLETRVVGLRVEERGVGVDGVSHG